MTDAIDKRADEFIAEKRTKGWVVIRNAPTVVATELRQVEAEALAFALNVQNKRMMGQ